MGKAAKKPLGRIVGGAETFRIRMPPDGFPTPQVIDREALRKKKKAERQRKKK